MSVELRPACLLATQIMAAQCPLSVPHNMRVLHQHNDTDCDG